MGQQLARYYYGMAEYRPTDDAIDGAGNPFADFTLALEDFEVNAEYMQWLLAILANSAAEQHEIDHAKARRSSAEYHLGRSARNLMDYGQILRVLAEQERYAVPALEKLLSRLPACQPNYFDAALPQLDNKDEAISQAADDARWLKAMTMLPDALKKPAKLTDRSEVSSKHIVESTEVSATTIKSTAVPKIVNTGALPSRNRMEYLTAMLGEEAIDVLRRRTAKEIVGWVMGEDAAASYENYKGEFKWLKANGWIASDGKSGYWLTKEGRRLAVRAKKSKP